jgi:aminopeptidase N
MRLWANPSFPAKLVLLALAFTIAPPTPAHAGQADKPADKSADKPAATAAKPVEKQRRIPPNDAAAALPTRFDFLRGNYGEYRANNDLLYYHLDIRVDPVAKTITGKNTIRFKMLADGTRIQLDLLETLAIDKILFGETGKEATLKYTRDSGAVFIDFPETLRAGKTYSIDFYYSGHPVETGRFGGITFKTDPKGRPWINTACEETGSSMWWPSKDQWRDEVENMDLSVAIPSNLVDVSNGKFVAKTDLGDGYTRWDWHISYPINSYDVSLNIGTYVHFDDKLGDLSLDFYVLPEDLEKAKPQFAQAKGMMEAFIHYFGDYPFAKDGYKLIQAPYTGMEHQTAVTYGNLFQNGYYNKDWTGVGISPRFDFIIIHESGHEWFGNAITAKDPSDMWIHEGFTTYLESLYVEYRWGKADGLKYNNGYKSHVYNLRPIVAERQVNAQPTEDQYFKGTLMLSTLRSVIDDDKKWFALLHDFYQQYKYKTIMTEDVVAWFNQHSGMNLTPIFNQYLRHTHLPRLELLFDQDGKSLQYKWRADEDDFAMPIRVGTPDNWQIIHPTTQWQTMKSPLTKDQFEVATDLYYVEVNKQ